MSRATAISVPELHPDMPMSEVLALLPGARRALFAKYHLGGCASCAFQPEETLAQLCRRHDNLPVEEMIAHLRASHENDLALQIQPGELFARLSDPVTGPPRLVDLRTREEYEAVALPGARLFSQDLQREAFGTWDKDALVVLYDHTGPRALDAAAWFAGHGFTRVKALTGGIDRYAAEADPSLTRYEMEIV